MRRDSAARDAFIGAARQGSFLNVFSFILFLIFSFFGQFGSGFSEKRGSGRKLIETVLGLSWLVLGFLGSPAPQASWAEKMEKWRNLIDEKSGPN